MACIDQSYIFAKIFDGTSYLKRISFYNNRNL